MVARFKTIFDSGTLKIEYDRNCDEYKFVSESDEWVRSQDMIRGAISVIAEYVKEST